MRGRERGEAYAAYCPERWDGYRHASDPHAGLVVMIDIERMLRKLDGPTSGQFYAFALHRYADRKPASAFPDGKRIEMLLLEEIGESIGEMAPAEREKARMQILQEGMRRRKEYLAAWIAKERQGKLAAAA